VRPCLRQALALASAVLAFGLAGCGGAAAGSSPLAGARLQTGTTSYAISGAVKGTATWTIRAEGADVDVTIRQALPQDTEVDRIVLKKSGLGLVSVTETITGGGHHVLITGKLQGGKLLEHATVDGKKSTYSLPWTSSSVVNEALLTAVAAIAPRSGAEFELEDVIVQHASTARVGVSAGAAVKVRTPAGSFSCVPVTLAAGGTKQTVWVERASHRMVRYQNAQTTFTLTKAGP